MAVIPASWVVEIRRMEVRPGRANSSFDPVSKIIRAKWLGGMTQVAEHLLCKLKALSSNPSPTKK
jgi:hypothetical protein